jgi:hypothetical protein
VPLNFLFEKNIQLARAHGFHHAVEAANAPRTVVGVVIAMQGKPDTRTRLRRAAYTTTPGFDSSLFSVMT